MPSVRHLFVYGSLLSPFRNPAGRALRSRATLVGRGRIEGRLYRIAGYPGLRPARLPGETVKGEVYRLPADAAFWKRMDLYEGAEYRRVAQPVVLDDGTELTAWTYRYRRGACGRRRIAEGDFLYVPNSVAFAPRWALRRPM